MVYILNFTIIFTFSILPLIGFESSTRRNLALRSWSKCRRSLHFSYRQYPMCPASDMRREMCTHYQFFCLQVHGSLQHHPVCFGSYSLYCKWGEEVTVVDTVSLFCFVFNLITNDYTQGRKSDCNDCERKCLLMNEKKIWNV